MKERIPRVEVPSESAEQKKNIYEKEPFTLAESKERVQEVENAFKDFFESRHYASHESVPVSSGIDPTVRFIGSHISVYKPYLLQQTIPEGGFAMVQPCVRTRNTQKLFDDHFTSNWGSYFSSFGTIGRHEKASEASADVLQFFQERFKISDQNLRVRVNSGDTDLLSICRNLLPEESIEIDTKPPTYYRHTIGMDGVKGRNFNLALRDADGKDFSDVGNVIVFEQGERPLGVEIALGSSVIMKQLYGLSHVLDCNPVPGLEHTSPRFSRKIQDAIIVSTLLMREGLKPSAANNRERILRTYVRSLSYLRARLGISIEALSDMIRNYEAREFTGNEFIAESILHVVRETEKQVMNGVSLSKEEAAVRSALRE